MCTCIYHAPAPAITRQTDQSRGSPHRSVQQGACTVWSSPPKLGKRWASAQSPARGAPDFAHCRIRLGREEFCALFSYLTGNRSGDTVNGIYPCTTLGTMCTCTYDAPAPAITRQTDRHTAVISRVLCTVWSSPPKLGKRWAAAQSPARGAPDFAHCRIRLGREEFSVLFGYLTGNRSGDTVNGIYPCTTLGAMRTCTYPATGLQTR